MGVKKSVLPRTVKIIRTLPVMLGCVVSAVLAGVLFVGCSAETPLTLGMITGISGGNTDLGQAGRNGAILAVEQLNRNGGIGGSRMVQLIISDDGNDRETAKAAARQMITDHVEMVVGPFTTAMCEAVLAETEPRNLPVLSPTASAISLSGKDDNFFRLNSSTRDNGAHYAEFMGESGLLTTVALVIDERNSTFAIDWVNAFVDRASQLAQPTITTVGYDSSTIKNFGELVWQIRGSSPSAVVMVANAVDVARLAQQLRKADSQIELFAAEWAGTQQLIELGGRAVDGLIVMHMYDMFGTQPRYREFLQAYEQRFAVAPSFSSIMAYEAVQVIAEACRKKSSGQTLREAVLSHGPYQGLQQQIGFDQNGDSHRDAWFVKVDGNSFVPLRKL